MTDTFGKPADEVKDANEVPATDDVVDMDEASKEVVEGSEEVADESADDADETDKDDSDIADDADADESEKVEE